MKNIVLLILIFGLTSCDPVHNLNLENRTTKPVIVIYKPLIEIAPEGSKIETIEINNTSYAKVVLGSGQKMQIGNVIARYTPRPDDVELEYLEVHIDKDTMKMIGKKSIFSAIQKIDNLDWRVILRDN